MKKSTVFMWAWNDYAPQSDTQMTRARAARLLRAWRRTSRRPNSMGRMERTLERIAPHTYRVVQCGYGESATLIIR